MNMELKIVVGDDQFKDVLENGLKAFSKEELHELIREAIKKILNEDDIIRSLFVTKRISNGYVTGYEEPTPLLINAAKEFNIDPAFKEIENKIIETLKTNTSHVLENLLIRMIIEGLTSTDEFKNNLHNSLRDALAAHHRC